jgi:hypothetical protein
MTMTGLRLPEPEHFDFVSEEQVRELISKAEHELSGLQRAATDAATGAELAEEQARSAGVDPRLSTRTMLRLQGFLDSMRAEVARETDTVVEQARSQAATRLEAARAAAAMRAARPEPTAAPDFSADPYDLDRLRRLLGSAAAPPVAEPNPTSTPPAADPTPVHPDLAAPAVASAGPAIDALVVEHPPTPSNPPTTLIAPVLVHADEPEPGPVDYTANGNGVAVPVGSGPNGRRAPYEPQVLPDDVQAEGPAELSTSAAHEPASRYTAPYEPPPAPYQPEPQHAPAPARIVEPVPPAPAGPATHRRFRIPMSAVLEVVAVLLVLGFLLLRLS